MNQQRTRRTGAKGHPASRAMHIPLAISRSRGVALAPIGDAR
eukprot:CAMPEP_0174305134 /NCGR_PEP_ID=MMETSP0809-20121228/61229_1 /TAXON_ID=73025 ORGANISM="Eutreptiella gymnastica-like, Strain CCMP1594" /NCGR_SAMPLE_ID=MMETSP0809 /ASSEMBLY_ACC=CAM_ASM_000658 /LENGTH=41 /DNA_ID= /DNA_START= /DNA_END= /DNA_ORIENTATION=